MKKVRAKFHVDSIQNNEITMSCKYSPEVPEDQSFVQATPWGEVKMSITNPQALAFFKVGQSYYADFTEVPEG